jgi:hypothetical protein
MKKKKHNLPDTPTLLNIPVSKPAKQYTCGQWSRVYPPFWTRKEEEEEEEEEGEEK